MAPSPDLPFTIRAARLEDAGAAIRFVQAIAAEPEIYVGLSEGDFNLTVEQEEAFIQDMIHADNSHMLVAEAQEAIIGILTLQGGKRRSVHHTAMLGISIAREWRNRGVGRALMQASIEMARREGVLKRIELNVIVENLPAVHLYLKFGFKVEGRQEKSLFRDGRYHDNYLMALLLDSSSSIKAAGPSLYSLG